MATGLGEKKFQGQMVPGNFGENVALMFSAMQKPVTLRISSGNSGAPLTLSYSVVYYGCETRCGKLGQTIVSKQVWVDFET